MTTAEPSGIVGVMLSPLVNMTARFFMYNPRALSQFWRKARCFVGAVAPSVIEPSPADASIS